MQRYKKNNTLNAILGILFLWATVAQAGTPTIVQPLKIKKTSGQLNVSTQLHVTLSSDMRRALQYEIPLSFVWEIQIKQDKSWYRFNKNLYKQKVELSLYYHPASKTYRILRSSKNTYRHFNSLPQALAYLSTLNIRIKPLPFSNAQQNSSYIRVKFLFNSRKLPAAMIPKSLFSSDWKQESKWQYLPLKSSAR